MVNIRSLQVSETDIMDAPDASKERGWPLDPGGPWEGREGEGSLDPREKGKERQRKHRAAKRGQERPREDQGARKVKDNESNASGNMYVNIKSGPTNPPRYSSGPTRDQACKPCRRTYDRLGARSTPPDKMQPNASQIHITIFCMHTQMPDTSHTHTHKCRTSKVSTSADTGCM